ncbi:MAG: Lrp/AsnC family transcriptional regulator [Thermoleophilia bacterium]|nr:Lrp/AsnC family transcriptional regulator [Thermoleophilia bacterium]
MQLDALDHHILTALTQDGRASNVQIAAELKVSHSTIKKRIDRLIDGGACRVMAIVDPETLGFRTSVIVLIRTRPGAAPQIVEALGPYPEVYWAGETIGRYGVFVEAIVRGPDEIFDLVVRRVSRLPGVEDLETLLSLRQTWWRPIERRTSNASRASGRADRWEMPVWRGDAGAYPRAMWGRDESPAVERLDDVDIQVIRLLQEDGRRPAAEIARLVRLSQPTVKSRIDRLVKKGVCKIAGVINPAVLGLPVGAHVYLCTDPGRTEEIGDSLARLPAITWLCHTAGAFDLLAEVHMAGAEEVLEFVGRTIAEVPGVRTAEVALVTGHAGWRPSAWCPPGG